MPKYAIVPSHLMGGPENPSHRWDAAYVMILADLINPEHSIKEAADLLERHLEEKRIRLGDIWRATNTPSAVQQLAMKFGMTLTDRVRQRFTAIFMELLSRHKDKLREQSKSIEQQLQDLDVRFAAESLAANVLEGTLDIDDPEQRRQAVQWLVNYLRMIKDGGSWAIPRSRTVYTVSHQTKTLTRTAGPGDPPTEDIAREAGWKVHGLESN